MRGRFKNSKKRILFMVKTNYEICSEKFLPQKSLDTEIIAESLREDLDNDEGLIQEVLIDMDSDGFIRKDLGDEVLDIPVNEKKKRKSGKYWPIVKENLIEVGKVLENIGMGMGKGIYYLGKCFLALPSAAMRSVKIILVALMILFVR